jgi:primosomal protein N' (replication factor Y)
LFAALRAQDYASFARGELHQREAAHLPPFAHQALLCADATAAATALEFLALAKTVLLPCESGRVVNANAIANPSANGLGLGLGLGAIRIAEPVPMPMARLAGRERAQLLLESSSRPTLQALLVRNLPALRALGSAHSKVHWHLEVDPLAI